MLSLGIIGTDAAMGMARSHASGAPMNPYYNFVPAATKEFITLWSAYGLLDILFQVRSDEERRQRAALRYSLI